MAADLPLIMSPPRNPATVKAAVALVILVRAIGRRGSAARAAVGAAGMARGVIDINDELQVTG